MSIPVVLYVDIMATAIPGEYFFDAPACSKAIGIIGAVPKPTKPKPMRAILKVGKATAIAMPVATINAQTTKVRGIPILQITQSELNREMVMHVINNKKPNVKTSAFTTSLK